MNSNRIKSIREENELTQKEIASMLNVSRTAYSLWEISKNIIPLTKLNDFSNKFDLSMDYIMGLNDSKDKKINHNNIDAKMIGKKIKQARKDLKLTQEKLAKIFNTTHSGISAYENGITLIPTLFFIELSRISNKSLDWFCDKEKEEK